MQITSGGLNFFGQLSRMLQSMASKVICSGYEPIVEAAAMTSSMIFSLRAATVDTTPLKKWFKSEYKQFEKVAKSPPTLEGKLDLCYRVLHKTKPAFKLLLDKVCEVSLEIENIDVSEQLTTLENKFKNKLKKYVNRDQMVRDDVIDLFAKFDSEHHILTIEFVYIKFVDRVSKFEYFRS